MKKQKDDQLGVVQLILQILFLINQGAWSHWLCNFLKYMHLFALIVFAFLLHWYFDHPQLLSWIV